MTPVLTLTDITTAWARIQTAGGTPRTFVCGPAKDADWTKVAYYVSALIDGEYAIGDGATLDAAVTHLLSGEVRRPLIGTQQLVMEGVA